MVYFNPLRNEADFSLSIKRIWSIPVEKEKKKIKKYLTFRNECDKVNELLMSSNKPLQKMF